MNSRAVGCAEVLLFLLYAGDMVLRSNDREELGFRVDSVPLP